MSELNDVKNVARAIENGTVIDHIPANCAMKVLKLLSLKNDNQVIVGINLESTKFGKKDLIKISDKELSKDEFDTIALIAPDVTVSIIENSAVVKKLKADIPNLIEGFIICPNPKCITNTEHIKSRFFIPEKNPIKVRCAYCEKKYIIDEVEISI